MDGRVAHQGVWRQYVVEMEPYVLEKMRALEEHSKMEEECRALVLACGQQDTPHWVHGMQEKLRVSAVKLGQDLGHLQANVQMGQTNAGQDMEDDLRVALVLAEMGKLLRKVCLSVQELPRDAGKFRQHDVQGLM